MGDSGCYWMAGVMALICCVIVSALFVMAMRFLERPQSVEALALEDLT